jgi:hypothetical protein
MKPFATKRLQGIPHRCSLPEVRRYRSVWRSRNAVRVSFSRHRLSHDAVIAANAALREVHELGPTDHEVPGFRGPPTWYR